MIGSERVKTRRRLLENPKVKAARKNPGRKNQGNEKYRLIWVFNRPIFKYCDANRNKMSTIQSQHTITFNQAYCNSSFTQYTRINSRFSQYARINSAHLIVEHKEIND